MIRAMARAVVLFLIIMPASLPAFSMESLQARIDELPEGGVLQLAPGTYQGPIVIDKPITLEGNGEATIDAGGKGTVVKIESNNVVLRGFKLVNSGKSHNDIDSGVQVRGNFNVVSDNIIEDSLFGVDLQQSSNNIVRRNQISSKDVELGQRGDAIRLWYSFGNKVVENQIRDSRDTVVWYSADNEILRNTARDSRYSLHFMYSRYNRVEGNRYFNNTVGIFLMYSDGVIIRNNHIAHAAGPTGVGMGFKETSGVVVTDNEVLYCASGMYVDLSPFQPDTVNVFSGNLIAYNGIGVRMLNDWEGNEFKANRFVDNLSQVMVSSGKTANRNVWEGNYWSDFQGFDQDQDHTGDNAYELYIYADRLWQDQPYAQFFKGSPMLEVLDFLERLAPFTEPRLLVRDEVPVTAPEYVASVEEVTDIQEEEPEAQDSLSILRRSLGRE